jgi:hypothetical protein
MKRYFYLSVMMMASVSIAGCGNNKRASQRIGTQPGAPVVAKAVTKAVLVGARDNVVKLSDMTKTDISVTGSGLVSYKFVYVINNASFDCSNAENYKEERPIKDKIEIDTKTEGKYKLCVLGIDAEKKMQNPQDFTKAEWSMQPDKPNPTATPVPNPKDKNKDGNDDDSDSDNDDAGNDDDTKVTLVPVISKPEVVTPPAPSTTTTPGSGTPSGTGTATPPAPPVSTAAQPPAPLVGTPVTPPTIPATTAATTPAKPPTTPAKPAPAVKPAASTQSGFTAARLKAAKFIVFTEKERPVALQTTFGTLGVNFNGYVKTAIPGYLRTGELTSAGNSYKAHVRCVAEQCNYAELVIKEDGKDPTVRMKVFTMTMAEPSEFEGNIEAFKTNGVWNKISVRQVDVAGGIQPVTIRFSGERPEGKNTELLLLTGDTGKSEQKLKVEKLNLGGVTVSDVYIKAVSPDHLKLEMLVDGLPVKLTLKHPAGSNNKFSVKSSHGG